MTTRDRVTCPSCHRDVALTPSHRLHAHGTRGGGGSCPGSGAPNPTIDLERVAKKLRDRGLAAYVEQTGGGTATLLVAERDGLRQACLGPGWFERVGDDIRGFSARTETVLGPDDDGQAEFIETAALSDDAIVDELIRVVQTLKGTTYDGTGFVPAEGTER